MNKEDSTPDSSRHDELHQGCPKLYDPVNKNMVEKAQDEDEMDDEMGDEEDEYEISDEDESEDEKQYGYPVSPGNIPMRTRITGRSEEILYCCICHKYFETYDDFYGHNPCEDYTDDSLEAWLPGGPCEYDSRMHAERSIEYLNNLVGDGGKKYEYVEAGPTGVATICLGPVVHINFKAKEKDCPDAQVETFFAQLRLPDSGHVVDCCVSLGPSEELPQYVDADLRGCEYCLSSVHHPAGNVEKLMKGVKREHVAWLYGDYEDSPEPHTDDDSD